MNQVILIVDDEPTQRHIAGTLILKRLGYATLEAEDGEEALRLIQEDQEQNIALVLLDLSMPKMNGLEVLEQISKNYPEIPVIIITGMRDNAIASKAIRLGALDYINKPIQAERLIISIQNALKMADLSKATSIKRMPLQLWRLKDLIGAKGDLKSVVEQAYKASQSDIPVHLCGETGVGKEILAQAIHHESKRRDASFITINCGAIPANLIESILFGHEKGSFTGAVQKTLGKFREANAGTIFLDEVGELPFESQVKLLRVLQQKEVDPVGATRPQPIDVRVLSATNKDLRAEVKAGRFREDLYYRLNVLSLSLPPLRQRRNDMQAFIEYFVSLYSSREGRSPKLLSKQALNMLLAYEWPGNIRQLENMIYRAVVISDSKLLETTDFSFETQIEIDRTEKTDDWQSLLFNSDRTLKNLDQIENKILHYVLEYCEGNYTAAAESLGLAKSTLYRKLKE